MIFRPYGFLVVIVLGTYDVILCWVDAIDEFAVSHAECYLDQVRRFQDHQDHLGHYNYKVW